MPDTTELSLKKTLLISLVVLLCLVSPSIFARTWWKIQVKNIPIEAEIVETNSEQQMGLGNRFSLPEGQGMLFIYKRPRTRIFWMKRMNFPIDIIWFRDNNVVKIEERIPFPKKGTADDDLARYGYGVSADMVLELTAGFVKKNHLALGDRLQILKRD